MVRPPARHALVLSESLNIVMILQQPQMMIMGDMWLARILNITTFECLDIALGPTGQDSGTPPEKHLPIAQLRFE